MESADKKPFVGFLRGHNPISLCVALHRPKYSRICGLVRQLERVTLASAIPGFKPFSVLNPDTVKMQELISFLERHGYEKVKPNDNESPTARVFKADFHGILLDRVVIDKKGVVRSERYWSLKELKALTTTFKRNISKVRSAYSRWRKALTMCRKHTGRDFDNRQLRLYERFLNDLISLRSLQRDQRNLIGAIIKQHPSIVCSQTAGGDSLPAYIYDLRIDGTIEKAKCPLRWPHLVLDFALVAEEVSGLMISSGVGKPIGHHDADKEKWFKKAVAVYRCLWLWKQGLYPSHASKCKYVADYMQQHYGWAVSGKTLQKKLRPELEKLKANRHK